MEKLTLAILASAVTMFAVLLLLDLYQIFVTPLSPQGFQHVNLSIHNFRRDCDCKLNSWHFNTD